MKNRIRCASFALSLAWLASSLNLNAQTATLRIERQESRLSVSWPQGLSLVQPQKSADLSGQTWVDFGAATTETAISDTLQTALAFYRLRFLAPTIVEQPQGGALAGGATANLSVGAAGTFPLTYQWRKNGEVLPNQTAAALTLSNFAAENAGDYSVVVANGIGAATSVVAVLKLSGPLVLPSGIYMGNFLGATNGGIVSLLATNRRAFVLGHNIPQSASLFATNFLVGADGSFMTNPIPKTEFKGNFTLDEMTGILVGTNGVPGEFKALRKPGDGIHKNTAGLYAGSFSGLLSGTAHIMLAPDGTSFTFLSSPLLGSGGSFGKIDTSNKLTGTTEYTIPGATAPALIQVAGSLNPATHQISGSYNLGALTIGTFSLSRIAGP